MLRLCNNKLGAGGVGVLAAALPMLGFLTLDDNKLDTTAMKQLVQGKWLRLEALSVWDNNLDDTAVFHLVSRKWWSLRYLRIVKGNDITAEGLAQFSSEFRDAV